MKDDKEQELGELFLINFVEALIENFPLNEIQKEIPEKIEITSPTIRMIEPMLKPIQPAQLQFGIKETQAGQGRNPSFIRPQTEAQFPVATRQLKPLIKLAPFTPQTQRIIPPQQSPSLIKLSPFLLDSSITSIECSGPEKNLIVHQLGVIKTIPLMLTQKEIEDIMQEFSRRTKIPLIPGVFKTAIDNFIVSAVISEFVGTRFYIEKVPQMNSPMPQQRIF